MVAIYLFTYVFAWSFLLCAAQPLSSTLHTDGIPTVQFKKLLAALELNETLTGKALVDATQQAWLRKAGSERFEMRTDQKYKNDSVISMLQQLGFVDTVSPVEKKYDQIIVHGASMKTFKDRVAFLIKQYRRGVRCKKIVFLTGDRPLFDHETAECLAQDHPVFTIKEGWVFDVTQPFKTEADMARQVWAQADMPKKMRNIPVEWIVCPMKGSARPTTDDTVRAWLKTAQDASRVLAISNQPHVIYQDEVVRTLIPATITLETVGRGIARHELEPSVVLDSITRTLYTWSKSKAHVISTALTTNTAQLFDFTSTTTAVAAGT